eukprot:5465527-Pleurochrysis_carterae.AAC.1
MPLRRKRLRRRVCACSGHARHARLTPLCAARSQWTSLITPRCACRHAHVAELALCLACGPPFPHALFPLLASADFLIRSAWDAD